MKSGAKLDARSCKLSTVLKYAVKNTLAASYGVCIICEPASRASHASHASHASQQASHASQYIIIFLMYATKLASVTKYRIYSKDCCIPWSYKNTNGTS